ncbi:NAD(P)/FAD-dependent oxidoreductase [Rhodoligotrophos defluvii]|uniref:NAD(P)/FAD-dependent oxidoreductase n=1 Tax=Rhodoligotrophos defluvii TaxID=2561934 RepID=UPI0010C96976|nr:FAD-binding oxidoreductase [Rhodoligotrophos defluvii]
MAAAWQAQSVNGSEGEATVDSLWAASAATPPLATVPLAGEVSADVAVIGGGFTGLSAALHLAEAGRKVVVLEAETIGFGASGRNGGQVNPGLKLDEAALQLKFGNDAGSAFYRLGQEAPDFLAALIARLGLNCRFARNGLVRLAHNRRALHAMQAATDQLERSGIAVERLPDREAVFRRVGTRAYIGGTIDPRGGRVHPLDLARELARAAQKAGATVHSHSRVTALTERNGGWRVETAGGAVQAREVVVATNGYTDGLIPGLAESLLPVNSFQIATAPIPDALNAEILPGYHTVYDSRRLILYFRKTWENRVVIGGRASFTSERGIGGARADYSVLEQVLTGIFPQLAGVPIVHRWTGLVCITFDYLPHYHRPAPGLHVLLGFNGRGVALSNRAGAWLARTMTGQPDSGAIPVTPIRPIPFHGLRQPVLNLAMQWNRVLDLVGR